MLISFSQKTNYEKKPEKEIRLDIDQVLQIIHSL